MLKENGQLIFICPEYWMNTTHSISLRNYLVEKGYFDAIYHFNETPIFSNASVSVVIFKYIKSKKKKDNIHIVKYYKNKALSPQILEDIKNEGGENEAIEKFVVPQFEKNKRWLLTDQNEIEQIKSFERSCATQLHISQDLFQQKSVKSFPTIGEVCEIGNGMVSGLDKAFQLNEQSLNELERSKSIKVIKAKNLQPYLYDKITPYIFANEVQTEEELAENYPNFYSKLGPFKEKIGKEVPIQSPDQLLGMGLFEKFQAVQFPKSQDLCALQGAHFQQGLFQVQPCPGGHFPNTGCNCHF